MAQIDSNASTDPAVSLNVGFATAKPSAVIVPMNLTAISELVIYSNCLPTSFFSLFCLNVHAVYFVGVANKASLLLSLIV